MYVCMYVTVRAMTGIKEAVGVCMLYDVGMYVNMYVCMYVCYGQGHD
jgi:hypothetical protein